MDRRVRQLILVLLISVASSAAAHVGSLPGFPAATWDVRRQYVDTARAALPVLESLSERVEVSRVSGTQIRVYTVSNDEFRYLVFIPEQDGEFDLDQGGTWILRRRASDGGLDQIKIFLRSHPDFFVRVFPGGTGRSSMSVFLAGTEIHRRIPLPVDLLQILEMPLADVLSLAEQRVDWSHFYPETASALHASVQLVAERARSMLHTLPDAEDGAMDQNGNLVLIESLILQDQQPGFNCSGFAKWIADGLAIAPLGRYLAIEPLKSKHLEYRGTAHTRAFEDERDPYFGLDWTRNLALAVRGQSADEVSPEAYDVRTVAYANYVEDAGYALSELPLVLYLEASQNPGWIYFASLSRQYGSAPVLHQHVHVTVLFPYFDERGTFRVAVMERNVESSVASLQRRYGDGRIHLVRVPAHDQFAPPVIQH